MKWFVVLLGWISFSGGIWAAEVQADQSWLSAGSALDGWQKVVQSMITDRPDQSCVSQRCKDLRADFQYVVYRGKQMYCYWDEKIKETGTDFDGLAQELLGLITDRTEPQDFYDVLKRWASAFHDGHVNAIYKPDLSDLSLFTAAIRFELLAPGKTAETLIVTEALDPELAKPGDVVLEVDGVPVKQALDLGELRVSGSTRAMRRSIAARRFSDSIGKTDASPLRLRLQRAGRQFDVELPRSAELLVRPEESVNVTDPLDEVLGRPRIQSFVLEGMIGYLRIDAFREKEDGKQLAIAMQRLLGTRALILDLRRNSGGDQSGDAILERLISSRIVRYEMSERITDFVLAERPLTISVAPYAKEGFAPWRAKLILPARPSERYLDRPVVALIGPGCFSSCDTFVAALKSNHLATLIGENTGGGTGNPISFTLASGFQFRYSVVRGRTAQGLPIEGVGTPPDLEVSVLPEHRLVNRDPQLEEALRFLMPQPSQEESIQRISRGVLRSIPPIWLQGLEASPSRIEELQSRRTARIDGR